MNVQVQPIYLTEHEQFNKYSMWKSDKINPETGSHLTADIQIHFIKRRYSGLCSALWGRHGTSYFTSRQKDLFRQVRFSGKSSVICGKTQGERFPYRHYKKLLCWQLWNIPFHTLGKEKRTRISRDSVYSGIFRSVSVWDSPYRCSI